MPVALVHLTDFVEQCRLRPPRPARAARAETAQAANPKARRPPAPPEIHWYDGYLRPSFESVSFQQWLRSAG